MDGLKTTTAWIVGLGLVLVALFFILAVNRHAPEAKEQSEVAQVAQPTKEADFASAKYTPVPSNVSASFRIEMGDANYRGTGQQGVLLETLDISSIDQDPLYASTTGYHFFLYNHSVHTSKSEETTCDLNQVVNGYSVLMMELDGEGSVTGNRIAQEGSNTVGYYPGADCNFIITGVHSDGTIPDDVWDRADALWQQQQPPPQAQPAADAPVPTTN